MRTFSWVLVCAVCVAAGPIESTDRLAQLAAPHALVDVDSRTVVVQGQQTIRGLDVATGKTRWELDMKSNVQGIWPAGSYLVARLPASFPAVSLAVVDPATHAEVARCEGALDAKPSSAQASLEPFSSGGTPHIRYEATMKPDPPRGARMTDAEMEDWTRRFAAGYACGVMALRIQKDGCTLESVKPKKTDVKNCEDRVLPNRRNLEWPIRIGELTLRVENPSQRGPHGHGRLQRTTLTVVDADNKEVWSTELWSELVADPPP